MAGKLDGRAAIVTGAGSGIGAATAAQLLGNGANVFKVDRGGSVDLLIDVTDAGAAEKIVASALERFGRLDILVPCAGIGTFQPIDGHTDELWDRILAVNLTAVFKLVRAALTPLKKSVHGRIVTIGSVLSSFGDAGLCAYATSKHGVLGLSRSLAAELGPFGITVNCVQPGAVETPMTAPSFAAMPDFKEAWIKKASLGRLGQPEDIARLVAFLVSDDAAFMSGHGVFIDGGAMQRQ